MEALSIKQAAFQRSLNPSSSVLLQKGHKQRPSVPVRVKGNRRLVLVAAQGHDGAAKGSFEDSNKNSRGGNTSDVGILSGEVGLNGEKLSGGDMLKLFQDAQENMLFLNKQRLIAIEELQKVERDREFLMAKVAQVEAEYNASLASRETLEQRLRAAEAALEMAESRGVSIGTEKRVKKKAPGGKPDPPAVWSNLLLRVDSLLLSGGITLAQAHALRRLVAARDIRAAEAFEELQESSDEELGGALVKITQGSDKTLHVVQVVTELAPVAEAGSLGTWVLGLCRALRRKGHTVEVILPFYETLDTTHIDSLREHPAELYSFFEDSWHRNKIWTGSVYGIPVTFIQSLEPYNFFQRDRMYGHEDDFERFTYFSRAALEYLLKVDKTPDVIHMHDWQTAVAAPLFWDIYHHQGLKDTRLMFTWHDTHYQNPQPAEKLRKVGLDPYQLNRPDRLQDPRNPDLVNLLKGGVVYSNKVTTVSSRYADDVKSPEFGCSLESVFQSQGHKVVGVLSGIDESEWDPSRDRALPTPYSAQDDFATAKAVARSDLRTRLGLPVTDEETGAERPLVACLVQNVRETELEQVYAVFNTALQNRAQLVFVGASRSPRAQSALEDLQRDNEDPNAKFVLLYENDVAHQALAAAQIVVCFTNRDPAYTLTMAGMKYGALPVSRQPRTGAQALVDFDDRSRGSTEGVGFFFETENAGEVASALGRAIQRATENPTAWEDHTRKAMSLDTSWDATACDDYVKAYWSIYRCS